MERKFTQRVRIRARPMRSLFHKHLDIADAGRDVIFRKDLPSNVNACSFVLLLEQQIENDSSTFIDEMTILQQ